jgi:hypothetical protein
LAGTGIEGALSYLPELATGGVELAEIPHSGIGYAGSALARGRRYAWQVRMWDENLVRSDWSEQAWFEVELDPAAG